MTMVLVVATMKGFTNFLVFCLGLTLVNSAMKSACDFPPGFKFGTATSAYQIEGAWNTSGKGVSIWDDGTHNYNYVIDGSNGDIACDSYNQIDVDVKNLKFLNVSFYRFSLSWTRILPYGHSNIVNPDGIRYYNELINALLANGIEPMVTLFHWDLPKTLQDLGGWTNPLIVDYFVQYAKVCFENFGDRVKTWLTFNEIRNVCYFGYEGSSYFSMPPYLRSPGVGLYLCGHHMLLSHGYTYKLKKTKFAKQKGEIGYAIDGSWVYPKTNSSSDRMAVIRTLTFEFDWIVHPVFSKTGDYPPLLKERIGNFSKLQGFEQSRLPSLTRDEVNLLRGSADFLGLNHYFSSYASASENQLVSPTPSAENDLGIDRSFDPKWESTPRHIFKVVPDGFRALLVYIKEIYDNPIVYITENGYGGFQNETTNDVKRIEYNNVYLTAMLRAINEDKCDVRKYTHWSFMDNFEWADGYTLRFGLFHVNFTDPKRTRTPKKSAYAYKEIIKTNSIPKCGIVSNSVGGWLGWILGSMN